MFNNVNFLHFNRKDGFTALEVLIAVTLSLILSVVAVVGFEIYQREQPLDESARRLARACNAARSLAISTNQIHAVQIDRRFNNFWVDQTDEDGAPVVLKVVPPQEFSRQVRIENILFGSGNDLTTDSLFVPPNFDGRTPIVFFPDGSSDDASVLLSHEASPEPTTVRVYGPTGTARVIDTGTLLPNEGGLGS